MYDKARRQAAVYRLVREKAVRNQNEIVSQLCKLGFHATQASVSRDARELGLVKVRGRYLPAARVRSDGAMREATEPMPGLTLRYEPVGSQLVVVRTVPGGANAVAVDIDKRNIPDIIGTLAGDDTIFIAVRSRSSQGRLIKILRGLHPINEKTIR